MERASYSATAISRRSTIRMDTTDSLRTRLQAHRFTSESYLQLHFHVLGNGHAYLGLSDDFTELMYHPCCWLQPPVVGPRRQTQDTKQKDLMLPPGFHDRLTTLTYRSRTSSSTHRPRGLRRATQGLLHRGYRLALSVTLGATRIAATNPVWFRRNPCAA